MSACQSTRQPRPAIPQRRPRCAPLSLVAVILGFAPAIYADDLRDFNADTPGKAYSPYTVARGYFQIESDIFHITEMSGTQTIESLDPVFKYGLTSNLDLELQTDGFLNMQATIDGRHSSVSGYGDITPGFKYNVLGNDSGAVSVALKAGIKIPTASTGFGNGAVEYNLIVPAQIALPNNFSLQVQQEADLLKNQNDTGKHFSYAEDISLSRSLGKFTLSTEAFAQSGTDPNTRPLYTADVGASYAPSGPVVISFGLYIGLNRYAPSVEAYTGFGFRF